MFCTYSHVHIQSLKICERQKDLVDQKDTTFTDMLIAADVESSHPTPPSLFHQERSGVLDLNFDLKLVL